MRTPEESTKKMTYGITLNPDLVEDLREKCGVDNLSAWVNEQIRMEVMRGDSAIMYACNWNGCKCTAAALVWNTRWNKVCKACMHDHKEADSRIRLERRE